MSTSPSAGPVLGYASEGVRSAPPKTLIRSFLRLVRQGAVLLLRAAQLLVLAAGYVVLALAFVAWHAIRGVAKALLALGRLRWDVARSAVGRWFHWGIGRIVRIGNATGMLFAKLTRRTTPIPMATPHATR